MSIQGKKHRNTFVFRTFVTKYWHIAIIKNHMEFDSPMPNDTASVVTIESEKVRNNDDISSSATHNFTEECANKIEAKIGEKLIKVN